MARDYLPHALALASIEGKAFGIRNWLHAMSDAQARQMLEGLLERIESEAASVDHPSRIPDGLLPDYRVDARELQMEAA